MAMPLFAAARPPAIPHQAGVSLARPSIPRLRVYMDVMNTWMGAAQCSAAHIGLARTPQEASDLGIIDPALRLKFKGLREFGVGSDTRNSRAVFVGSVKTETDRRIQDPAERAGWIARMPVRSISGREKEVDTGISVWMLEDQMLSGANPAEVEVTLICGDRDQVPAVQSLMRIGVRVDVAAWSHTASQDLIRAARRFIPLDDYFDTLTFREGAA